MTLHRARLSGKAALRHKDEGTGPASPRGVSGAWIYDPLDETMAWSKVLCGLLGLAPGTKTTADRCFALFGPAGWARLLPNLQASGTPVPPLDETLRFIAADGRPGWLRVMAEARGASDGQGPRQGYAEDVTGGQVPIRSASALDGMTGLPSRPMLLARLDALLRPEIAVRPRALLRIVIDDLKGVNEQHGSPVGDNVLQDMAAAISAACRTGELVARIGSAEFALLASDIGSEAEALRRAGIVRDLLTPLPGDSRVLPPVTVSIGVSLFPGHAQNRDDLMAFADLALVVARASGRDRTIVFRREFVEALNAKQKQQAELRHGLSAGQLDIFYQPIVDLRTSIVRGWEALVRWRHPVRGLLTPGAFLIGLADEALAMDIDRFVLRGGLFQMRAWLDAGVPVTCVGVNTSAHQLRRADFVDEIAQLLDESRLTPDRLKLEVLETAFFGDRVDQVADTIARLSRMGVVCSLDDFGTGYASLTHLKTFKVERLKIDMSFIKNILSDPFDKAITRSVIDLGRNLGLRVTAEGIETPEQLRLLQDFGCDCGQGYLFGRPMPADEVPGALAAWHGGRSACILDHGGD